ncbi:MAG: chloride channel protein [Polyangiaceae bacterium]|nr:chloride channel protein [Polyangiaceae bacterium]
MARSIRPALPRLPTLDDLAAVTRLFELRTASRWVGLGLVVGIVSGLGAAAFYLGMNWIRSLVFESWAHMKLLDPHGEHQLFARPVTGTLRWWVILLAPALGGLFSGLVVFHAAPEAEGHGTDELIDSFHRRRGHVRARIPLVKALASVVLIGTGGSAGREGPIAQIGAGFGSIFANLLHLSHRERRLLLLAGAAGGIGAIFRTPLGAALFVAEVLYRDDFEVDALVPAVLSSVVAYSVFTMFFGQGSIFVTDAHFFFDPRQLPLYALLAALAALVGVLYVKVFYGARNRVFAKLPIYRPLKPMLGGLALGGLALLAPQTLGAGYGWLQEALMPSAHPFPVGWIGAATLLGIALAKVLATTLSIASGGSGGVFGPSVVIGGMLGGAVGLASHALFPQVVPQPGAFVVVGMACFFGGVAHAPISSLVMATEMTASYDLLVPIMLAEVVTVVLIGRSTLYEKQVRTRRESPAHGGEYVFDVLREIPVRGAFRRTEVVTVPATMPLEQLLRHASESAQLVFPITSPAGSPTGIVTLDTLRGFFFDEDIGSLAIAADCASRFVAVSPDDSLDTALQLFGQNHYAELPVVGSGESHPMLGLLSYEQLLEAYSRELTRRRLEIDGKASQRFGAP